MSSLNNFLRKNFPFLSRNRWLNCFIIRAKGILFAATLILLLYACFAPNVIIILIVALLVIALVSLD